MLGELIDNMVSIFAPARAARRAYARRVFHQTRRGNYEAAKLDRTTSSWAAASSSADRALYGEADRVRYRARDLIRNNAYARGALDAIVANVVGVGICPRPALDSDAQNEAILRQWNLWIEREADITGRLHFYEMQGLALRELVEAGESLLHYVSDDDPLRSVPFSLELIEADRLASDTDTLRGRINRQENEVRRGVEINRFGKPLRYWIYPTNPDGLSWQYTDAQAIEAREILHLFRSERIGQTRGISWLAPAVIWLRDLGLYVDNEMQASAVASCFGVMIKTVDSGATFGALATPSGEDSTDTDGNRLERMQPGLIAHLMPGEDIATVDPGRPNSQAEPWINLILRSIAVGMGLSYELVSRDYSRTNFSSNRASTLEDRRRFRPVQKFLMWHLCQPVYREWFFSCVMKELEGFPTLTEFIGDPDYWLRVTWQAPGWEWVDPLKDAKASETELNLGLTSRQNIIAERGEDWRDVFAELSAEQKLADQLGLQFGQQTAPQDTQAVDQTQDTGDAANETEDAAEPAAA